jgi:hypothetical protein
MIRTNWFRKNSSIEELPREIWKAKIEHKEKLTIEDAKFLFDQAEKTLKSSIETSEIIVSRMNTAITLITACFLAFLGYIISRLSKDSLMENGMFSSCVGAIYLYFLAIYSFINTHPKSYFFPGAFPQNLFAEPFFADSIADKERITRFYINEIEIYQQKIIANTELNETDTCTMLYSY